MAIRYAGDAEIHIQWTGKVFRVRFKTIDDLLKGNGTLTPSECRLSHKEPRTSPEAYDKVGNRVVAFLRLKGVRVGELHRVFQAPCPVPLRPTSLGKHHG
jgi:hypothetical protein